MSLLLSQPSLCFQKPVLVRSSPLVCNASPQNLPFATLCTDPCRPSLGTVLVRSDHDITPLEGKLPMDMLKGKGVIGSSNGWVTTLEEDGKLELQDIFVRKPERVSLPPLQTLPLCQTQIITNIAMSLYSLEDEDCVVAVKFLGPQLSFYKPGRIIPTGWTNIRIPNPCFFSSPVMFSKRDEMFHIPGSGGHLIGSWDLHKHTSTFHKLQFHNLPDISNTKRELLDSCSTTEHLVESESTGEIFMVKWYRKTAEETSDDGVKRMETIALMVFELDYDYENADYTEDIGDLIIVLTKSESFCVPADSFPDMRPNSVKIMDVDETTIVDLAAQKWTC